MIDKTNANQDSKFKNEKKNKTQHITYQRENIITNISAI